ncbi:FAD-dependent oxidoreductase [Sphingobium subterraneum]|uniref:FAD dependent oxidoreductase n=1 Tax=Sphingobium subterraneum TaxID=627688 RepID=A0A841J0T8_9SPHN|nr:FAD-dependent oxidoreductase [Sphingobium subterraneum]MBB6122295.1 hypothetical protein [Sphingobium subterraneum]
MSDQDVRFSDVLVVGGTAAGCAAAIAAAREGASVTVLEPTASIGGVTANGVHCFDTGSLQALSGIAEEFIRRVVSYYQNAGIDLSMIDSKSDIFWEFHVAEKIWREMIAEHSAITFINGAVPVGVKLENRRILGVNWERAIDAVGNLPSFPAEEPVCEYATTVIDATYEGDVASWSGARFDLGREGRSREEPHAGIIHTTTHERDIHPSGFLPSTILPGSTGEGDNALMAFTCRLSLRYRAENYRQHLLQRPADYDPDRYSWSPPPFVALGKPQFGTALIPTVAGKMLTNQRYRGDDLLDGNRAYILADPRARMPLRKRFFDHALGFLHFIQNEGGMPQLGLADDEYPGNGHVPHNIYVREGRRFRGYARMTESDVNPYITGQGPRPPLKQDSIAIGDWAIESRRCSDHCAPETGTYDGSMFIRALRSPYQVPMGCLVPEDVDNLLVTTTISASHVAFCALRVEALWTETGTAAGIAAALAARYGCRVIDTSVYEIQKLMLQMKCKLTYFSDVEAEHPSFEAIQSMALKGFVPCDGKYRFFPERNATWFDLLEGAVLAFDVPISVTGLHFEHIEPGDPAFRYAESLYDAASRAGIELFPNMRHPVIDAPADHLRPEARVRWISIDIDGLISRGEAAQFLARLRQAMGLIASPKLNEGASCFPITRAELCVLLIDSCSE